MSRTWRRALTLNGPAWNRGDGSGPPQAPRPLLPSAVRPLVAVILAVCVAVTVSLGVLFAGQTRAGWLDRGIDLRIQASFAGHSATLNTLAGLGNPVPATALSAALLVACLAIRRWRGALLVAVAPPAADAITELVLKPLIGRTLQGHLSLPSGHATTVFALATALAVLLVDPVRPRMPAALRLILALAALVAAGAAATALVGLDYHYFTDTVAGAAVGTGAVLATALTLDRFGRSRPQPPPHSAHAAPSRPTRKWGKVPTADRPAELGEAPAAELGKAPAADLAAELGALPSGAGE